jgi:hypothetical protein
MKSKTWTCIIALTLFATLAMPVLLVAQNHVAQKHDPKHHQYQVVDLGTFGGPGSTVNCCAHQITARGVVVGSADTSAANPNPGCFNGPVCANNR